MPLIKEKPKKIDVANLASKLPRPLQWPAGALGGLAQSMLPDDEDVASQVMPTPLMAAESSGVRPAVAGLRQLHELMSPAKPDAGATRAWKINTPRYDPYNSENWNVMQNTVADRDIEPMISNIHGATSQSKKPFPWHEYEQGMEDHFAARDGTQRDPELVNPMLEKLFRIFYGEGPSKLPPSDYSR